MELLKSRKTIERRTSEHIVEYREVSHLSWKNVFHLPSEPVWYIAMVILSYVSVIGNLYLSVNAKCLAEENISGFVYALDMICFLDAMLSIGANYVPDLGLPDINLGSRPTGVLVIESLSCVPIELMISQSNAPKTFCFLRVNRSLRIVRLIYYFKQSVNIISSDLFLKVLSMFTMLIFISMVTYTMYCSIHCLYGCPSNDACFNFSAARMVIGKIFLSGTAYFPNNITWNVLSTIGALFAFYFIIIRTASYMTIGLINLLRHEFIYVAKYTTLVRRQRTNNLPNYIINATIDLFHILWEKRGGYNVDKGFLSILPHAMRNEIAIDISWPALKHSKLFRTMDLAFLRYMSSVMQQSYMNAGEFVFRKNEWKECMIYVVSGTIELLSEEDGESPIMSFTSGTCLGESSLLISYQSINSVRCKTFCEIHVLEKKHCIKAFRQYPDQYAELRQAIRDRYQFAIETNALAGMAKTSVHASERQVDIYTIFWIKNILHKMMAKDAESTFRHEFQNIYLLNEINETEFNKLLFTANYLDMLVIGERIEADTDMVFVKSTCPCILQPYSIVIVFWETLIIIFTIALSYVVPYMSFVSSSAPGWYSPLVYITTIIYWIDIYVQLSTGVRVSQGMSTKVGTITTVKMQSVGFWADLISCVPCEMFSSIVLNEITSQLCARMHLNRIVKLWRVNHLFLTWEKRFNTNVILIRFLKFSWINLYMIYSLCCLLYNVTAGSYLHILFIAVQVMTNIGLVDDTYTRSDIIFLITKILSGFIIMLMYSNIGCGYVLHTFKYAQIQELSRDLIVNMKSRKLWTLYSRPITNFLVTQSTDNEWSGIRFGENTLENVSKMLLLETYDYIAADLLRTFTFFQLFSNDIILDICYKLSLQVFPPESALGYVGDLSSTISILIIGNCELADRNGDVVKSISTPFPFNLLEACLGLPSIKTCITKTYCKFLILNYRDFQNILVKYPKYLRLINAVINSSTDIRLQGLRLSKVNVIGGITRIRYADKGSFVQFGYHLKADSYEEFDYFVPFDHLYPFGFVRYFLLRTTILPDGKFLYIWESFRCFFAVLSVLIAFLSRISVGYAGILFWIPDLAAVIDIYVRLHVCYYNEHGVLITHPLKTAVHYISHSFVIDLVGLLRLNLLIADDFDIIILFALHINRILQMHRYMQFFQFLQKTSLTPLTKWYAVIYIPIMLVLANIFGCVLVNQECTFDPVIIIEASANFTAGIKCKNNSLLSVSSFVKPIDPIRAHLYGVYVATTTLTTIGMQGFILRSNASRFIISGLSLIGLYITIFIGGKILALHAMQHGTLLSYQAAMKSLKVFMNNFNISASLKKTIIDSYELKWHRINGKSIYELTGHFNVSLQMDILYDYFGKDLYITSVFDNRSPTFYRNLVARMKHDIIIKGGYMKTINDISNKMHVLLKGSADVLAADGIKLATLYPGSIYGNLEKNTSRQLVSVVANSHVELMTVESLEFYKLMPYYPEINEEFQLLKAIYLSYIPSKVADAKYLQVEHLDDGFKIHYFNPKSKYIQFWNALTLVLSCYLAIFLELYQITTGEFSGIIIAVQYMSDIIYLLQILVNDRTAYEDENGNLVTDLKLVRQYHRKKKSFTFITMISLLPIDAVPITFPLNESVKYRLYSLLRLNRFLRLFYLFEYFKVRSTKLNINVYVLRFQYLIIWSSLSLSFITCLFSVTSCPFEVNMFPHVPNCTALRRLSSRKKFELYIRFLSIVADCFMCTAVNVYYPEGVWHILLCILCMIVCQNLFMVCVAQSFNILNEAQIKKFAYRKVADHIFFYLRQEEVSVSLLHRVWNYIQLLWISQEGELFPKLLNEAPCYLKDAITNDAFAHLLIDHEIFQKCHSDCIRQIVQKLTNRIYFTGDYVEFKGSTDVCMYFVYSGEVAVLEDEYLRKDDYLHILKAGESFGILPGLKYLLPYKYSYRCTKTTILLILNLSTWEHLLDFFPASKETIYRAAEDYEGY